MAIDGTVVAPGAKFDFWKAVGTVSVAKGYKLGGAIINGHSVEGKTIGGGICSTSTTLFNAALRAGLEMDARANHYYYISRYPLGLDATVWQDGSAVQDMSFTNDTAYPILIRTYAKPGIVRFTMYSVPSGRTVTISKPIVKNLHPRLHGRRAHQGAPPGPDPPERIPGRRTGRVGHRHGQGQDRQGPQQEDVLLALRSDDRRDHEGRGLGRTVRRAASRGRAGFDR